MDLFDQITRTKIFLPRRRPDLLSRQRLLDLLYNLLDYKLAIIAAPPGYGKTSLLVDIAHQAELPFCWCALDSLDQDIQRFLAHFIAAIHYRFPEFGQRSAAVLQNITGQLDSNQLVTTIVNEICEHIHEYFVLILDDYHLVNDNQDINYFVNQFIQQVDENCHLVISSRTLLSLPDLPLMVARSQVGGLSFEELAFRADEIQELVLQNHHLTIPKSEAETLVKETEGWITGLLLSTQSMWQGMSDRLRLARVSGVGLYDYLAQQVLDQQPTTVRDFLLRTSIFEEFNAELCKVVLESVTPSDGKDWTALIDIVSRGNLFVVPVEDEQSGSIGGEGMWLRYHHLFRDFLWNRLAKEHPQEKEQLLRRLANVYVERQEWEKAHDLYQQLGDVEASADLIEQVGLALVRSGRLKTLSKWLDALPPDVADSRSLLLSLRGIVAVTFGEAESGLSTLNQAQTVARARNDQAYLARALVWRAVANRFLGNYQASLADADEALELAVDDDDLLAVQAEALKVKGLGLHRMGSATEALHHLQSALTIYQKLGDVENVATVNTDVGIVYMTAGFYRQALAHYDAALDHWRKRDNIIRQANLLNNIGVLHHLKGDYEQAHAMFEEALGKAKQSGHARIEAFVLVGLGDLYTDLEALDAALVSYRQAREIAQRINYRFLLFYLNLAEASVARLKEDFILAHNLLSKAEQHVVESGSDYENALCQMELAALALVEDKVPTAISHLKKATYRFKNGGQQIDEARAHLRLAVAYDSIRDWQTALDHLSHTFSLTGNLESWAPLIIASRNAKHFLEVTQDDQTIGPQVVRLLNQVIQFEKNIPSLRRRLRQQASTIPFSPPKLIVQALGRSQLTLDGEPVTHAEWRNQKKGRELFFYLLAHPEGLTKESAGSIFWQDSSPSKLRLQFKNTIYRLRSALGKDMILLDETEECYHFNRAIDFEYDVELFLKEIAKAKTETDRNEQATAYRAATRLYRGPYLPEVQGIWIFPERERLQQNYLEAALKLAEFHLEIHEYNVALEYCRRALAEDVCLEEAHRLAMRTHAALGNQAAVVRQFERCQQILLEKVNASPSPQTKALYETLVY